MLAATERECRWCWLPLGLSLLMAYLTRPTMALLAVFTLGYALVFARRTALLAASVLAAGVLAFSAFSLRTFGTLFPPYYGPQRLEAPFHPSTT